MTDETTNTPPGPAAPYHPLFTDEPRPDPELYRLLAQAYDGYRAEAWLNGEDPPDDDPGPGDLLRMRLEGEDGGPRTVVYDGDTITAGDARAVALGIYKTAEHLTAYMVTRTGWYVQDLEGKYAKPRGGWDFVRRLRLRAGDDAAGEVWYVEGAVDADGAPGYLLDLRRVPPGTDDSEEPHVETEIVPVNETVREVLEWLFSRALHRRGDT